MSKPQFILERCCQSFHDTIHSYEITHVSRDTTISLEILDKTQKYAENALEKANGFYKTAFDNLVAAHGNYLTIICIAISLLAALFTLKIIWDTFLSRKLIASEIEKVENKMQRNTVLSYILSANQIYKSAGEKCNGEVFFQYYQALNYVLTIPLLEENEDLYICILNGIHASYTEYTLTQESIALTPLLQLKYGIEHSLIRSKLLKVHELADQVIDDIKTYQSQNGKVEVDNQELDDLEEEST